MDRIARSVDRDLCHRQEWTLDVGKDWLIYRGRGGEGDSEQV
jgi:hypothetical protein